MKALFSTYMRECKDVFTHDYLPTLRKIGSVLGAVLFYTAMVIAAIMMFTIAPSGLPQSWTLRPSSLCWFSKRHMKISTNRRMPSWIGCAIS